MSAGIFSDLRKTETNMDDSKRRLVWHGMFLFLLGLLTGFVEQQFANPRMGLAAHISCQSEVVMNPLSLRS